MIDLQDGESGGQVAGQGEGVGHAQSRWQRHRTASGGVAQRTLVRGHHDDARAAAHPHRRGRDQWWIAGVVAGDDQDVEGTDPWRRIGGDDDRGAD